MKEFRLCYQYYFIMLLPFFLIIDFYFLIAAELAELLQNIAEFVILIEIPTKESKTEMDTHSVIVGIAISECSI